MESNKDIIYIDDQGYSLSMWSQNERNKADEIPSMDIKLSSDHIQIPQQNIVFSSEKKTDFTRQNVDE